MTRRYYLNGVELTSVTVTGRPRQDQLDGLTSSAFGGDIGTSGVIIDDPTGSVTIAGLQPFYVDEDSCAPPRVWTGYIGARRIMRGDLGEGRPVGRRYDCDLMDLNFLLGLRVLRDAKDDKRPQETDAARVAWMIDTPAMTDAGPGIFDNGFISATSTHVYDEADLFSEFPDQSLNAIMAGGKTYFLYWDAAAASGEEVSLFYGEHAVGFGNLSVKLSNVRADIDDSNPATQTTFSVHDEVQVHRDPQVVEDGVLYLFLGGQAMYRQLGSTFATFGIHRDGVLKSDRVGKPATAEGQTAIYLAAHAAERDTITCTVRLKKNQINWFREGWRVQAKFSHLPGYTSFTYVMIEKRTVALAPRSFDTYDVTLELTSAAPLGNGPGGGDPGAFPHNPLPAPEHYYSGTIYKLTPIHGADSFVNADTDAVFLPATTYNWSMTVTEETVGGTSSSGVFKVIDEATGNPFSGSGQPTTFTGVGTFTGSFTIGGTGGLMLAQLSVLHNDVRDADATITFFVDPVGWVVPVADPPSPAESVPPEFIANGDGTTTLFHTLYPYAPGSLKVFVDGHPIVLGLTETDPTTGAFTIDFAPLPAQGDTPAEKVTAAYQGAAGGSTSIIGFGARTIEVSA